MKITLIIIFAVTLTAFMGCGRGNDNFDAAGSFETEETIISSEAAGTIKQFNIEEGRSLKPGENIGFIDTVQLYLKKVQLESQISSTLSQKPDIAAQIASLQVQLQSALKEQKRVENLVKASGAPQKQLDDADAQVEMLKKQIEAERSSLGITTKFISRQAAPLQVQIEETNNDLQKCYINNPVNGTVLAKYAEKDEMAEPGKPLYKIADLSTLFLRAYITGSQLSSLRLNQKVRVFTDEAADKYKEYPGTVSWISDKAEFTPKSIPTKEERANLVYAVKIKVKNDGLLKIGMYGEVKF